MVFFQQIPTTGSLAVATASLKTQIQAVGWGQVISETDRTINGVSAKDMVYSISTTSGVAKKERIIAMQDSSNRYYIVCSAPTADFDRQQSNFNLIIDSFKIQ
nr:PsbP-related protein [Methanobacterium subterraneum]